MLRKIRITTAVIFIFSLTLLFLDFTGTVHQYLGWAAKTQLLPAILAMNAVAILILLVITLLFGRLYCSVICPLGVFQDAVSWLAGKRKRNRFKYSKPIVWLRYTFLFLLIAALVAGFSSFVGLLDPYAIYGRIVYNFVTPLYQSINNGLALLAQRADSYLFYSVDIWLKGMTAFVFTAAFLIGIGVLAWRNGRTYCNTICPVGTFLGFFSRFALLKPVFNAERCNHCKLCSRNCKSSCIDAKTQSIDYSRCVMCMDCIDTCNKHAISLRPVFSKRQKENKSVTIEKTQMNDGDSRRQFLSMTLLLAASGVMSAQQKAVEGGLAVIKDKKMPKRATPVAPPGSSGHNNFTKHCTSCGLCISSCPNEVLRPSSQLATLMQPYMTYERGFCRPECTKCSEVCPTSSITKITSAEKTAIQIGYAVWIKDNCVVLSDKVECGNCARHCPVGAIQMIPSEANQPDSRKIPSVDTERCIGCGACEYLCPSRPYSAIYVEGTERHRTV